MGLLSCQRISRVLTRIGERDSEREREGKDEEKEMRGGAQSSASSLNHKWFRHGHGTRKEPCERESEAWPN